MRTERDPDGRVFIIVEHEDEIPTHFASEKEEAIWWDTHDFSDELRAQMRARPVPEDLVRRFPHAFKTPTGADPA